MPASRVSARVVYSGSLYQVNHRYSSALCDCMAFWCSGEDHVYALELKNGSFDVLKVARQLQGGADVISEVVQATPTKFYPVLVHSEGVNAIARKALARCRVNFRGRAYRIFTARCGSSLSQFG